MIQRISPKTDPTFPFRGKDSTRYEYGSQSFVRNPQPPPPVSKWDTVKTLGVLSFGIACLGVGFFPRKRY